MEFIAEITTNQEAVWKQLLHAMDSGSFPQSILIEGKPGVGKKALAMQLGIILKCTSEVRKPCGECFNCLCAKKDEGPNFLWLPPVVKKNSNEDFNNIQHRKDAINRVVPLIIQNPYDMGVITSKAYIPVNMVRDIKESLSYRDKENRVVFIPEADRMNKNAANALLKVLEEVPDKCYFILTTSNRSALLPTILSRCLQVSVPNMDMDTMESVLSKFDYAVDQKDLLCRISDGSPGQAMDLLNIEYRNIRNEALKFLILATAKKYPQLLKQVETQKLSEDGSIAFCDFLYMLLHDAYLVQSETLASRVRNIDIIDQLQEVAESFLSVEDIYGAMGKVVEYRKRLFTNAKASIALGALGLDLI